MNESLRALVERICFVLRSWWHKKVDFLFLIPKFIARQLACVYNMIWLLGLRGAESSICEFCDCRLGYETRSWDLESITTNVRTYDSVTASYYSQIIMD